MGAIMRQNERDFVAAMAKGLAVIEAFDPVTPRLALSEVARKTGITRAAARRYLLTLAKLSYAESDGKYYWLTPRVLRLGYAYLSSASLPKLAQPVLESVGERTQEVASIAVLDGEDILFVARSAVRRILVAATSVGTRFPAYCTAMGRVLLASLPDAEIEQHLKRIAPKKLTPKTKTGMRELMEEINRARKLGYAVSDNELEIGLRTIAVPVPDSRGKVDLAMAVSLQAGRMSVARMVKELVPALRTGARQLSAML